MMPEDYELVVIGAGPAGMEAAISASESGVKTAIVEGLPLVGGQCYRRLPAPFAPSRLTPAGQQGEALIQRLESTLTAKYNDALAWGLFEDRAQQGWLVALEGSGSPAWLHARTLVIAAGAYDTPVAFPGWTLPGVITCGAALILAKSQRIAPGRRAVVSGSGPLLLSAAAHLTELGVEITVVCETSKPFPRALALAPTLVRKSDILPEAAKYLGSLIRSRTPYKFGWSVFESGGDDRVEHALIGQVDRQGFPISGTERKLEVDMVVCGYGLTPNVSLARMLGCQMAYEDRTGGWLPVRDATMRTSLPGVFVAGDGGGIRGAQNARLEGRLAGISAAHHTGHLTDTRAKQLAAPIWPGLAHFEHLAEKLTSLFPYQPGWHALARDETVLCRCEEVRLSEIEQVVAEGARCLDEVKMVTRAGMGNCQGRMCESLISAAMLMAIPQSDRINASSGQYSIRPPLHPVTLGALARSGPDT